MSRGVARTGRPRKPSAGTEIPRSREAPAEPVSAGPRWPIAAVCVAAAALALHRFSQWDYWFHLAAGRWILAHGLPDTDPWNLAARGRWPWLAEWLFHPVLYLIRAAGGDVAVGLWRAAWAALATGLAFVAARTIGASTLGLLLLSPLVLAVARWRWTPRPEQLSLAFLLLQILLFERARRGGSDRTAWMLPVQVLWANLHPDWMLGPAMATLYAASEWLGPARPPPRGRARRWGILAAALIAASALTPRPLDTLTLRDVRDVRADPATATIDELQPWTWGGERTNPFTGWLAVTLAAAVVGGRSAFTASPPLAVAATLAVLGGLASYRFQAQAVMVSLAPVAVALTGVRAGPKARRAGLAVATAAAAAGLAWLVTEARYFAPGVAPHPEALPVRAVALADSLGLHGPVLNTQWYGSYILWVRGEPHVPLVDTRHFGDAVFRSRYLRAASDPAALDTLLSQWRFSYAVLAPPRGAHDRMAAALAGRRDWTLIFSDDAGLLFVRRDHYPSVASTLGYRWLTPDYERMAEHGTRAALDPGFETAFRAELERARSASPLNATATLWLGLLDLAAGRTREAVARLDEVERLAPLTPGLALRQGLAREQAGDREGARAAYRRALREPADAAAAREALKRLGD